MLLVAMLEPSTSHHNGNYSVFAKFTLVLFALVVVYAVLIACLSIPWLQRLYVISLAA